MKTSKKRTRLGAALFFIPIAILLGVVVYAFLTSSTSPNGTLIIRAQTSGKYYGSMQIHVSASVSGTGGVTPFNLTLSQGAYTVVFSAVSGYTAPPSSRVAVSAGRSSYAVGVYTPIPAVIAVGESGFNVTKASALAGVTPVIWVNEVSGYAVMNISPVGRVLIPPGGNYTYVFETTGSFSFAEGSHSGTVSVS